jgi:hypothetical protein
MAPFIRDGDIITVAPFTRGESGMGQIVAFVNQANQRLVVHRIVGRYESSYLIQGDNLPERVITKVDQDGILGRVVRVERGRSRVRLGLGPERLAIAFLSRLGLLVPARARAGALTRFLRKRRREAADRAGVPGIRGTR